MEEIPENLRKYVPDFEYILYDLTVFKDSEIKGKVKLRIFLEIMKYIFTGDQLKEKLIEIFQLTEELAKDDPEEEYFETLIKYILNAQEELSKESLTDIAVQISNERGEKVMTAGEKLINQGISIGMQRGIQQGLLEGIEGMLEIKFGKNGLKLMRKVKEIHDLEKLEIIKKQIKYADTIEELKELVN